MKLIAKTFHGLEEVLANELSEIGALNIKKVNRAVEFEGDKEVMYKANLHLRTAIRILQPLMEFKATNDKELYDEVQKFDWSTLMGNHQTLAIDSVVFSEIFTHSQFVALKTKDAIVDQFRNKTGERPSVNVEAPDIRLVIHMAKDKATISLDSSGDSLHKRGYRVQGHKAPLNEVLAAGMVLLSGWNPKIPLVDPMCGSGTILMEAVMIAKKFAPSLNRKNFGFMTWNNFDKALWEKIVEEAKAQVEHPRLHIYGSDINMGALDIARESALSFRFNRDINFKVSAFEKLELERPKGMVITNPPYGERLMKDKDIMDFYRMIGNQLDDEFLGYDAWLLSSDIKALNNLGIEVSEKKKLFNGSLECGFYQYKINYGKLPKIIKFR